VRDALVRRIRRHLRQGAPGCSQHFAEITPAVVELTITHGLLSCVTVRNRPRPDDARAGAAGSRRKV